MTSFYLVSISGPVRSELRPALGAPSNNRSTLTFEDDGGNRRTVSVRVRDREERDNIWDRTLYPDSFRFAERSFYKQTKQAGFRRAEAESMFNRYTTSQLSTQTLLSNLREKATIQQLKFIMGIVTKYADEIKLSPSDLFAKTQELLTKLRIKMISSSGLSYYELAPSSLVASAFASTPNLYKFEKLARLVQSVLDQKTGI